MGKYLEIYKDINSSVLLFNIYLIGIKVDINIYIKDLIS